MFKEKEEFIHFDPQSQKIYLAGKWTLANLKTLKKQLKKITIPKLDKLTINGKQLIEMDSAGAWLLNVWLYTLQAKEIEFENVADQHQKLLTLIEGRTKETSPAYNLLTRNWLDQIGKMTVDGTRGFLRYLSFIGELTSDGIRVLSQSKHLRWRAFFATIDKAGYQALFIIALMSLMIGVVIAYQSGLQLRKYGAGLFIVDLMGYSILREFGPLITAIMVAGRTGSAFTAQLGLMNVNQEIDALNTMGVTPGELLILPRIAALVVLLPLLTIWSDIFGVIGGMISSSHLLHIGWYEFLQRFQKQVDLRELIIGLGKAPVFALIIASIGCYEGMNVKRSAESVGLLTTRSVVLSIFFIVVADSLFAIVLNYFKL